MSASPPLRRSTSSLAPPSLALPSSKALPAKSPPAPRIFVPPAGEASAEHTELFDFKAKPGYYNAAAKAALLRRSKNGPHDQLSVDFSLSDVRIGLTAGGVPLLSGDWTWRATAAGHVLTPQGRWSEVCWRREDAFDYLEIELGLTGGSLRGGDS